MIICLIRHGETVYNLEERMQGVRDIALTPRGLADAALLGKRLREAGINPRRIYTSPVKRALDSAKELGFGLPLVPRPAFSARSLGDLEGLTKNEIRERFPGAVEKLIHWDWCPPAAAETLRDMFRRADAGVREIEQEEGDAGLGVVVTHSGVLEALARGWLGLEPHQDLPFPLKNSGAFLFARDQDRWVPQRIITVGEGEFCDRA